ncbi:MAG: hypothetical protein J6X84_06385 [Treponema sp.]|nr:hypothetical protein [Treponema sp.]
MKNLKKTITKILFAALALFFISCGNAKVDSNGCYKDVDDAIKAAKKKNQDIMVIITMEGDDYSSSDFLTKVVRDSAFKTEIASKYAVVCMDFSQATYQTTVEKEDSDAAAKKNAKAAAALMQKNTKFARMLNARETPVVYFLSKEQYLITGLFYDDENRSLEGFKTILSEKSSSIEEMRKMIYQTKIGTELEKVAAIDALFEATGPYYRFLLLDLISSVKKLDPSDKSGLLVKYLYEEAVAKSDKALLNGKAQEAAQAYLDIENEERISAEDRQQALTTVAYLYTEYELSDTATVIDCLERALRLSPESEQAPAIRRVIQSLSAK